MDAHTRRRASSGAWVAIGPATELEAHAAARDIIELTTPTTNAARVVIVRTGTPFTLGGERWAYGVPRGRCRMSRPATPIQPRARIAADSRTVVYGAAVLTLTVGVAAFCVSWSGLVAMAAFAGVPEAWRPCVRQTAVALALKHAEAPRWQARHDAGRTSRVALSVELGLDRRQLAARLRAARAAAQQTNGGTA